MEKVFVFLDFANIDRSARDRRLAIDYRDLLSYLSEGRFLIDAYAYVPIDPRNENRTDGIIEELWAGGYIVRKKRGQIANDTYKCNFDVELAIDVLSICHDVRPDIIVVASGDADFVPMVLHVRNRGIRLEIASFESSAARDLILRCSGFIDLEKYCQGREIPLLDEDPKIDEEQITEPA
jgi:uncharacterized LabA/DUF88 family protein